MQVINFAFVVLLVLLPIIIIIIIIIIFKLSYHNGFLSDECFIYVSVSFFLFYYHVRCVFVRIEKVFCHTSFPFSFVAFSFSHLHMSHHYKVKTLMQAKAPVKWKSQRHLEEKM